MIEFVIMEVIQSVSAGPVDSKRQPDRVRAREGAKKRPALVQPHELEIW